MPPLGSLLVSLLSDNEHVSVAEDQDWKYTPTMGINCSKVVKSKQVKSLQETMILMKQDSISSNDSSTNEEVDDEFNGDIDEVIQCPKCAGRFQRQGR